MTASAEPTIRDVLQILTVLTQRFDAAEEQLKELARRMANVENGLYDLKETVESGLAALDKDAVTIMDHERRIRRLEKRAQPA